MNREIHFHTKSTTIRSFKRCVAIWPHAFCFPIFLTWPSVITLLLCWSQWARSTSAPRWAESIPSEFVIFSWRLAANNLRRRKRSILQMKSGTQCSQADVSARRHCLASAARGWQIFWMHSKNTSSVFYSSKRNKTISVTSAWVSLWKSALQAGGVEIKQHRNSPLNSNSSIYGKLEVNNKVFPTSNLEASFWTSQIYSRL